MNAREERERVARLRAGRWIGGVSPAPSAQRPAPSTWRTHSAPVQVVFGLLTALGTLAFFILCNLLHVPRAGFVTAIVAIVVAELLIHGRRWYGTGVEGTLWLLGLFAVVFELEQSGQLESPLALAAACAVAGRRVRNPLFGAGAAVVVVVWFERRYDLGVVAGLLIAAAATLLLLRTWRRPSTEWLLTTIVLVLPPAAWPAAGAEWRTTTIALYASFAAIAFLLGVLRRHHAMLFAGLVSAAIAATELAKTIAAPAEAKLFAGGALLLVLAFVVARALRGRSSGIVSAPVPLIPFDEELQLAATLAAQPRAEAPPDSGERGGRFGGAGASGSF